MQTACRVQLPLVPWQPIWRHRRGTAYSFDAELLLSQLAAVEAGLITDPAELRAVAKAEARLYAAVSRALLRDYKLR